METSATKVNEDFLYMNIKAKIIDQQGLIRTVTRLAHEILERNRGSENIILIGMRTTRRISSKKTSRLKLKKLMENNPHLVF